MTNNSSKKAIIIGGGISGAATAYSLAQRGYKVTIYERNYSMALNASGNYQALLYGTFHGNYTPLTELHFMGLHYSVELIKLLLQPNIAYEESGLIQLFDDEASLNKTFTAISRNYKMFKSNKLESLQINYFKDFCHKISVTELSDTCNAEYCLYFPNSLWLHPQDFVNKLIESPNIKVVLNAEIDELNLIENQNSYLWQLKNSGAIIDETETLILCNANAANKFLPHLDLLATRGQTTKIKSNISVKTPICKDSYILPASNGYFTIGATFKPHNTSVTLNHLEHTENINAVTKFYPEISNIAANIAEGHAAIRCSVKDYLPVVGTVAKHSEFIRIYAKLALDKNLKIEATCPNLPGLYLNIAHGSKGFTTAPISGEIIAQYIAGEKSILNENILKAIHPNRIYLNKIIKSSK